jgi:hypothetical protein
VAALCGLEASVGKVYSHDTYLNINSTSFTESRGRLRLVPYVNLGLVEGMTRSGGQDHSHKLIADTVDPRLLSLGARHHQLMDSCPPDLQVAVHRLFIKKHFDLLKSVRVPWFVPESLGGVGLKPLKAWKFTGNVEEATWSYLEGETVRYGPSDQDQDCMAILQSRYFRSVVTRKLPTAQPIQIRSVWYSRKGFDIPRTHVGETKSLPMTDSDISFMDLSVYYLAPSLAEEKLKDDSFSILAANQRAWSYLSRVTAEGSPLVEAPSE